MSPERSYGQERSYNQWIQVYRQRGLSEEDARTSASRVTGYSAPEAPAPPKVSTRGFSSGFGQGIREGVGSYGEAVGTLTGGRNTGIGRGIQSASQRFAGTGYSDDLSGFGKVGRLVGRVGTELGTALVGGGLAIKGARAAPVVGSRISRALDGANRAQRGLAYAVAGSPVDVLQGVRSEDGFILPGRAGAIAENIALSGTVGALLPRGRTRTTAAEPETARAADIVPTPPRGPETRPDRLLPSSTSGPARPMRGATEANRRLETAASAYEDASRINPQAPPRDVLLTESRVARPEGVSPGRPTFRWNEEQGRFVIVDRKKAARVKSGREALASAEESAELRRRLGGAGPQIPSTQATRSLEAAAESGRRMREAQKSGSIIRDDRGFISADALLPLAGAGLGGLSGAGVSEDPLGGAVAGAAVGAGLGLGAGRLLRRANRAAEEAVPRPDAAPDFRKAVPESRPTTADMSETSGFDRIDYRASPYPKNFPQRPKTLAEHDKFLEGISGGDPEQYELYKKAREAGQIWSKLGKVRLSDVEDLADVIKREVDDLAIRSPSRSLSTPEIWALQKQYDGTVEDAKRLLKLQSNVKPGSDQFKFLEEQRDILHSAQIAMMKRLGRDESEWGLFGRVIQASRKQSDDPRYWLKTFEAAAGRDLLPEEAAKMIKALEINDQVSLKKQLETIRQTGIVDKGRELYTTGLLTSLMRPARDLLSSLVNVGDMSAQMLMASKLDQLVERVTSIRSIDLDARSLYQGAVEEGLPRGLKSMWAIARGKGDPEVIARVMERYDLSKETVQTHPVLKAYTTLVRRTIGAPDAIAYETMQGVALTAFSRAYVKNFNAVKTGAVKYNSEAFDTLVRKTLQNPPLEIIASANEYALQATFQNATALGNVGLLLRRSESKIVRALGTWIVPFIQTPASITTQTVKGIFAPVSFAYNARKAAMLYRETPKAVDRIARAAELSKAQRETLMSVARGSAAYGWLGLGYMLAGNDRMAGWYPSSDRERRRWELEGRMEGSIKIGSSWITTLGLLGPQAQLMSIGAGIRDLIERSPDDAKSNLGALAAGMGIGAAQTALDSPMTQSARQLIDLATMATRGDQDAMRDASGRAAQTLVGGFVPQIVQQFARATDVNPEGGIRMREVREPGDPFTTAGRALAQGIPGLRQTLPTRMDALGMERAPTRGGFIPKEGGVFPPFFALTRLGREQNDPVAQEFWRTNAALPRVVRRRNETQEQYEERARALGEASYKAAKATMASASYKRIAERDVRALRRELEGLLIESSASPEELYSIQRLSDEDVRSRLQGMRLESAATRARARVARKFREPVRGRDASTIRALSR